MDEKKQQPRKKQTTQQQYIQLRKQRQYMETLTPEEKEVMYDKLHRTAVAVEPKTFSEKRKNFWYHYKWHTIISIFLLILLSMFIYEMVTKDRYDIEIAAVTTAFRADLQEVMDELGLYTPDIDKNGEHKVCANIITLDMDNMDEVDYNTHTASVVKLSASLSDSTHLIFLVDQTNYDYLTKEAGLKFADLTQYSDHPDIDGDKFYIQNHPVLGEIPYENEELFLVIGEPDTYAKSEKEGFSERYDQELQFLINLMNDTPVDIDQD